MRGVVLKGSRNLFVVRPCGEPASAAALNCRIKGKVLKTAGVFYNPLAPGDEVDVETVPPHSGTGLITGLRERRTVLTRLNRKGELPQILAANVDIVVCVSTPAQPPFRPRFIDRVLVQTEAAGIPACIVMNKRDIAESEDSARLAGYERLGYPVLWTSAVTGAGLAALCTLLAGKIAVLLGQSGVGKSSLLNALCPPAALKTGALNEKYDRGTHTTVQGVLLEFETDEGILRIIDTPGVRQFVPCGVSAAELETAMREFAPVAGKCAFGASCTHESEPDCAVRAAVEHGGIHPDRYESFLRIKEELRSLEAR